MVEMKWGVLSTARIGLKNAIPGIAAAEGCTVAAIASRDGARAEAAAKAAGIPRAHASYEALLADPEIDAVYNPLPNHLHAPWTIAALKAGKHVLCEKPVALSAEEAREVERVAAETGRIAVEAFMVRHHPQWRRVRRMVTEGRIGTPRVIHTIFAYHNVDPANIRNRADIGGGGGLYDIGCYAIATARLVFGAEPERVIGEFDMDPEMGTDRLTSAIVVFPGGARLVFSVATQGVPRQNVEVLGTTGRIMVPLPFNAPPDHPTRLIVDDGSDVTGGSAETVEVGAANQFTLQAEAFRAAVRGERGPHGDTGPEWGMDDAVLNMRVIDALMRSRVSGAWERP